MRPGTPGFLGGRLKQAREARGLSAVALADLLGVSRQAISQYESGTVTPHPDMIDRLCARLNMPSKFFFCPSADAESGTIFFRSLSSATKTARLRGGRRLGWVQELVCYLREFIEFPAVNFPAFDDIPQELTAIKPDAIESVASRCRQYWDLGEGPITHIVWLLECNGAIVTRDAMGVRSLDAFSVWSSIDGCPYVVLGADKESAVRSRFDAAHELGHLILHRHLDPGGLRQQVLNEIESQANAFASAFLLPAPTFLDDYYGATLDLMLKLKSKWRVSVGAMIKRLATLNVIDTDQERRLWMNYSRKGWRGWEPLDESLPIEQPRSLSKAIEMLLSSGVQTRSSLIEQIPYHITEVEGFASLSPGYLSDSPSSVRIIEFPQHSPVESDKPLAKPGEVLSFPKLEGA